MNILENQSLLHFNTFNIDISAKYFCETQSLEDIQNLIQSKKFKDEKYLILGGGSNILFTQDFDGIVMKVSQKEISILSESDDEIIIEVNAGYDWDSFVDYTVANNWFGLENLSLIPGTVGASPIQNIGAYGVEVSAFIVSVNGLEINSSETLVIEKSDCNFKYRDSIFKNELKHDFIVTSVVFKLSKKEKPNLQYSALSEFFTDINIIDITAESVRNAVIKIRQSKLPDPQKLGNAGSFFKNPIIAKQVFDEIKSNFKELHGFSAGKDLVKISAGWLIEKCGMKGLRVGDVGVYDKQALVIVNYGKANGSDIKNFTEYVIEKVKNNFGINLIPEVNII